jgi:DNA-binding winged helix-turn-helix (wHTH) protein
MTNVVDVYINYLRRKIDFGHDRVLIRTVRGVGYQIGGGIAPPRPKATVAASVETH